MTKWHGSEEGARRHRRRDIWSPNGDILGSILGAFWGPFGYFFGVRSALGRKFLIKRGGGGLFHQSLFANFWKKKNVEIVGPEKGNKIGPKMTPKHVSKRSPPKDTFSHVFSIF